jgi:competence protein ComEC
VTSAGLVLNLLAVPAMVVLQIAATVVTLVGQVSPLAYGAGWVAHLAATALVASARLVEVAPWLAARVPPPGIPLVLVYYLALVLSVCARGRWRIIGGAIFLFALVSLVGGADVAKMWRPSRTEQLRVKMFDVGQGESMLLEHEGRTLLIDTGGAPFGSGFDIGRRVLAPALWARGLRSLNAVLITHGDPDHLGGALAVTDDFRPREIWEGIRLPEHLPTRDLLDHARRLRIPVVTLRAGQVRREGNLQLRILHPPPPDWERRRVRNDDSVVIEALYGDVAFLLTGDISADIERSIVPLLTPSRVRILKVAHHGSRTSSSAELLEAWRPQMALISSGRGNRFGHPTREVLGRLAAIGATVLRTDQEGQITLHTDGRSVRTTTFRRQPHE